MDAPVSILEVAVLPGCDSARAASLGASMLARAEEHPEQPPLLVIAELKGEALLLGRHQRCASCLDAKRLVELGLPVARRTSGGRTIQVGQGTVAVLLALPELGALQQGLVAPDKLANRHVRGLLAGLTRAGATGGAHYFGRDFVSAQSRQLAIVGQDTGPQAGVLEAWVAVERPLGLPLGLNGYPEHSDPRAEGPSPTTLAELRGNTPSFEALAEAITQSYASTTGAMLSRVELPALPERGVLLPTVEEVEMGLGESGVADVPIGFAEALCAAEGGHVREVRLRGDFLAPAFAMRRLEEILVGTPLDFAELGRKVDAAFHQPGAFILGVRELRVFADAILEAARPTP